MSTLPFLNDTFTGVAGTALESHVGELGATWVSESGASNAVITDANRLRSNGVAQGNFFCASGTPATPDYWVEAQMYVASVLDYYAGVGGRMVVNITSGYWAIYRPSLARWELALAASVLGSYAQVLTVGQTYTVRLDMVGTTIRLLVDGVERVSVTNATLTVAGKAGVILFGTHTNTTGMHLSGITSEAVRKSLVVCDGDSMTAGTGTNSLPWPTQLDTDLDATWTIVNKGVSGQTLAQMDADATTDIDPLYSVDYARNVLVCFGGVNDEWQNADGNTDDASLTTLARLATYCSHRQAVGWTVIVVTMLPSTVAGGGALPAVAQTHFNTRRAAYNTSVRANYLAYANQVADIAANGTIGDDGDDANATYYQSDKLHPTNAGATIIKDIIKAVILAPILPVTGTVTTTFAVPSILMTATLTLPSFLSLSPVAEGVYGALQDATLAALLVDGSGVQSDVPESPAFPFVWFEVSETQQFGGLGTRPGHGALPEVDLRVHVFQGNYGTMRVAEAIMSRVIEVLTTDDALVVPGYTVCGRAPFYDETIPLPFEELNGVKVQELVARFRLYVEEAA